MPLTKTPIDISFAQGLDTKTDPKRLPIGRFRRLENMVFTKGGLLLKRNGYGAITALPDNTYSYLTTFNENLTALGNNIAAYNNGGNSWVQRGTIQPLALETLPLLRNNFNQVASDAAIAPNGVICTAYIEVNGGVSTNRYVIADATTGQNISSPKDIPVSSGTVSGGMRVFVLGNNFIIVFTNTITATAHLQYIAINIYNPAQVSANTDIASVYVPATTLAFDAQVVNNALYVAYNTTSGGQAVKVVKMTSALVIAGPTSFAGITATMVSVTADMTNPANPYIYISTYDSAGNLGFTAIVDQNLGLLMSPLEILSTSGILNLTSSAQNGVLTVFAEKSNNYSFDAAIPTHFILSVTLTWIGFSFNSVFANGAGTITASGGAAALHNGMFLVDNTTPANITAGTTFTAVSTTLTLSAPTAGASAGSPGDALTAATVTQNGAIIRSVGLASKSAIINGQIFFLATYQSAYQPTYFLINGSTTSTLFPVVSAKLAYQNGGGYLTKGLPALGFSGMTATVPYLFKDLIQAVNKGTALPAFSQTAGIYSQTGINLAFFTLGTSSLDTAEIGNDLHISGGFLGMYDGFMPVEHNFFLWPDMDTTTPTDAASWSAAGGNMAAQPDGATNTNAYYYQVTFEWTDNQGNAFRSAPSIPIAVTTTGNGTTGSVTLQGPYLRLTMKSTNKPKIVIYRWSVKIQNYYQVTSITAPLVNDTTSDSWTFVDTLADADVLGNNLIYTTGGVIEDVNAPATNIMALFDTRLWVVDAEDQNLVWYSKQVIESVPVEMSDLLTMFIPQTVGTNQSTGPIKSLFPMDDKLIFGKDGSFVYINGAGPDNTGENGQYSQPTFITATIGCNNQRSFVLIPDGLMFQSTKKGIWLLDRGLGTSYIGAEVEDFTTGAVVNSAVSIPDSNMVVFTLSTGITLMYDYFYKQWGAFVNVPAVSSCIWQGAHTYINSRGAAFQQQAGTYLDGASPVLMAFKTGPIRLGDLQNYQRIYFFYLLGTYVSPHKLNLALSYDYQDAPTQTVLIAPVNFSPPYGSDPSESPYGEGDPYGGPPSLETWRIFPERQRCMAFAIEAQEIFDPTLGAAAGAGLTLSGINAICGFKKPFRPQTAATSAG